MIPKFNFYKEKWGVESRNSIEPGLEKITEALIRVGNPHLNLNSIHVAGTNGKGSTITMMKEMFLAHGLTTSCFYSPCFIDVHDQIQLNNKPISSSQLDQLFQQAHQAGLSGMLTDFELLTVIAFMAFKESNSDIVLLETGMGGRYDSTNVITPLLAVITSISIEHEHFLGTTLSDIAFHKAGIIKEGIPAIVGSLQKEALDGVKVEAKQKNSKLWILDEDFSFSQDTSRNEDGFRIDNLTIGLKGLHQTQNAALAIHSVLYVLNIFKKYPNAEKIREALKSVSLPGRFERINEQLYFDGAHNPASVRVLVETVKEEFPNEPIHFMVGLIKGKNAEGILTILEEVGTRFTFVDFPDERAMRAQELMNFSQSRNKTMTKDPVSEMVESGLGIGVTIVTGSLYLIANLREKVDKLFKNI